MDREKVILGLAIHADGCGYRSHYCDDRKCPYRIGDEECDIEEMCRDALALLKEQPKIVRCKDCKHYHKGFNCDLLQKPIMTGDDWFCADGIWRESE